MARYATIDVGTNSVLLLVAERDAQGRFRALTERAEITRLGRGVDASGQLSAEGMEDTLRALVDFAKEARGLGAKEIAVTATSAARDAKNGAEFLSAAKAKAGLTVEIISGEEEANLSFAAVCEEWKNGLTGGGLVVIDIGGGSTELIYGAADKTGVEFRKSFNVGSVRMTERFVKNDPPTAEELLEMQQHLAQVLREAPPPPPHATVVGVAGTVTTLYAIDQGIDPYDPLRVQGGVIELHTLERLRAMLASKPLAERQKIKGLQPKRADVIPAGAMILELTLKRLGATQCGVSDRGLRWGLLAKRFGPAGA